jgi:hypothetical protein
MRDLWVRLDRCGQASLFVVLLIGTAIFPRLAYRLRWPTRLRGWRLAGYIAHNAFAPRRRPQRVTPRQDAPGWQIAV